MGIKKKGARAEFRCRIEDRTGVKYRQIPISNDPNDLIGAHIMCHRGDVWVVAVGYPDRTDEDGTQYWDPKPTNFLRVIVQ